MVIGVEGNVHVGKTTFIKNNFKNFNIINETKFQPSLSNYDRQLYYIKKELERKNELIKDSVLDRTIISIIIYTMYTKTLNLHEKKKIIKTISEKIKNNEIIIPSYIYLIIYPYKLITINHAKLVGDKGTQNSLADYDYYLNYSIFFFNRIYALNKIIATKEYRQIISYGNNIFDNITAYIPFNSKILLDGFSVVGRSTIGKYQKKYQYIEEFVHQKYTLKNYISQINIIIDKINILNKEDILIDTSFLMEITYLFYHKPISKKLKLKMIDEIMNKIALNNYVTKIIYLIIDNDVKIKRKENDEINVRDNFYDNSNYLNYEINFYKTLNRRLGKLSNINFVDASDSVNNLVNTIENIDDKPLMLIDLFYEIKEGIKDGEL